MDRWIGIDLEKEIERFGIDTNKEIVIKIERDLCSGITHIETLKISSD